MAQEPRLCRTQCAPSSRLIPWPAKTTGPAPLGNRHLAAGRGAGEALEGKVVPCLREKDNTVSPEPGTLPGPFTVPGGATNNAGIWLGNQPTASAEEGVTGRACPLCPYLTTATIAAGTWGGGWGLLPA